MMGRNCLEVDSWQHFESLPKTQGPFCNCPNPYNFQPKIKGFCSLFPFAPLRASENAKNSIALVRGRILSICSCKCILHMERSIGRSSFKVFPSKSLIFFLPQPQKLEIYLLFHSVWIFFWLSTDSVSCFFDFGLDKASFRCHGSENLGAWINCWSKLGGSCSGKSHEELWGGLFRVLIRDAER